MTSSPSATEGIFDFEDDAFTGSSNHISDMTKDVLERLHAALPKGSDIEQIAEACQKCMDSATEVALKDMALMLYHTFVDWEVVTRSSLGSTNKQQCLTSLRHSFVVMQHRSGRKLIIDPCFRDSFALGHSNERYDAVINVLPSVFVGTAADMAEVVRLMAAEISDVYFRKGLSVPPWRQSKALMSRWLSSRKEDLVVGQNAPAADLVKSVVDKAQKSVCNPPTLPPVCEPAKVVCGFPAASVRHANNDEYWVLKTAVGRDTHAFTRGCINDVMYDGWGQKNDLRVLDGALKDRMWSFRKVKLAGPAIKMESNGIAV